MIFKHKIEFRDLIEPVYDHRSKQNKIRTIFCKNTFLNQKQVFPKLVFPKLDFESDKENSLELFSKTLMYASEKEDSIAKFF